MELRFAPDEWKRSEGLGRLMDEHREKCWAAIDKLYQHWLDEGCSPEYLARCRVASDISPDGLKQAFWLEPPCPIAPSD